QAEDGIRDKLVTGVQTCALPISAGRVLGLVVRAKEVAAGDVEVGAIDESAVLDDKSRALGPVAAGQLIPGDRRHFVVQSVEIIEIGRAACRERGGGVAGARAVTR